MTSKDGLVGAAGGTVAPVHRRLIAWTGALFIVGSALFAAGVVLARDAPDAAYGAVFFVGSVFFTTAAALQLLTAVRPITSVRRRRWLPHPRHLDRLSALAQLVGTVYFNVDTWRAWKFTGLTAGESNATVWRPDAIGSVLFLVSSVLACLPEIRDRRHRHVAARSRWIAALNLSGSILFGLSAVGSYLRPTGEPLSGFWSDWGTFLGALCFLVAAALLLPRPTRHPTRHPTRRPGT